MEPQDHANLGAETGARRRRTCRRTDVRERGEERSGGTRALRVRAFVCILPGEGEDGEEQDVLKLEEAPDGRGLDFLEHAVVPQQQGERVWREEVERFGFAESSHVNKGKEEFRRQSQECVQPLTDVLIQGPVLLVQGVRHGVVPEGGRGADDSVCDLEHVNMGERNPARAGEAQDDLTGCAWCSTSGERTPGRHCRGRGSCLY